MARKPVKTKIVEAVGTASGRQLGKADPLLSSTIEQAMSAAAAKCAEDGERDPDVVRAAMLEARETVKAKFAKEAAAAAAKAANAE